MRISCVEPLGISLEHFEELRQAFAAKGHEFRYYMDRDETEAAMAEIGRAHV